MSHTYINKLLKTVFLYLIFFIIIYNETIPIFGIKISMIWKLPIFLFLLIYNLNNIKQIFLFIPILLSINIIINTGFPSGIFGDISEIVQLLSIPLIYYYAKKKFRRKPHKLESILISISSFYIISTLPFIFEILEPRGLIKELDKFGSSGNMLNGIFFHPSISSKVYVVSTLIIFNYLLDYKRRKKIYYFIFIIGIASIYLSFTRTGWLTFIMGIILLLSYRYGKIKVFFKLSPLILICGFLIFNLIGSDDSLRMRIIGERTYRSNSELDINKLSSNRVFLYFGAYQIITNSNIVEKLIGYGHDGAIEQMGKQTGLALTAHNRFLEIILMGGFISFLLYFMYLYYLYKYAFKSEFNNDIDGLVKTLFILLVIYNFPSHGFPLWCDILFALTLALHKVKQNEIKQNEYDIYYRKL